MGYSEIWQFLPKKHRDLLPLSGAKGPNLGVWLKDYLAIFCCFSVPQRVSVGSITASSAHLSWQKSSKMEQTPLSFQVSYQSEGTEPEVISSSGCDADITDLRADTEYTVKVRVEGYPSARIHFKTGRTLSSVFPGQYINVTYLIKIVMREIMLCSVFFN